MQVVADREPNYTLYVTLPEEDTVMSILELSEHHDLIDFHIQALEAYCSVSSHSNLEISEAISSHFDSDQLLQCLRTAGMRYELRAAYLRLLSYLHLEHEVRTRLMMRGEFILPLSDCTRSVPLFPLSATEASQRKPTVYRIAMAPLFGLDSALCSQANISHDITSTFSKMASCSASDFPIHELKELVFTYVGTHTHTHTHTLVVNTYTCIPVLRCVGMCIDIILYVIFFLFFLSVSM